MGTSRHEERFQKVKRTRLEITRGRAQQAAERLDVARKRLLWAAKILGASEENPGNIDCVLESAVTYVNARYDLRRAEKQVRGAEAAAALVDRMEVAHG